MNPPQLFVEVGRECVSRRGFLKAAGAAAAAGWLGAGVAAAELRRKGLACILLFMQGGPSQFETFDPKPGTASGGDTGAIDTAVPGVQVAEFWPKVAARMKDVALVRSMTTREGNHIRARYLLHTGYQPSGSVKYPNFGSTVAKHLGDEELDLPSFVCVGGPTPAGAGFLGMRYSPFQVGDPTRVPVNLALPRGVDRRVLERRLALTDRLSEEFAASGGAAVVADHKALNETAARMSLSPKLAAFDLAREKPALRDEYGRTPFGQGCLLARRLVEAGVPFVEVVSNGWDTHRNNRDGHKRLAGAVDPAMAALLRDLKDRGRLEKTLVVWMGEFGRTPTINGNAGRDHYPRAFCAALAGAGVNGGRVVGATDKNGYGVRERPVTVPDLYCTLCGALGINPRRSTVANGRPIRVVEGGEAVREVLW